MFRLLEKSLVVRLAKTLHSGSQKYIIFSCNNFKQLPYPYCFSLNDLKNETFLITFYKCPFAREKEHDGPDAVSSNFLVKVTKLSPQIYTRTRIVAGGGGNSVPSRAAQRYNRTTKNIPGKYSFQRFRNYS